MPDTEPQASRATGQARREASWLRDTAANGVNIYTANADGTGLSQVTFDGNDDDPAWGTHPLAETCPRNEPLGSFSM